MNAQRPTPNAQRPTPNAQRPIYDITKFTMLDYPDELACIIWFSGCNMRCPYCYNPDIVSGKGHQSERDLFDFLESRKLKLDGVVLSGGEATLYPQIVELCRKIKAMGFLIKLDTNGSRPEVIQQLLSESLIDYVAMDFKAPQSKYELVSKLKNGFEMFCKSLKLLNSSKIQFEIRTTVHTDLISEADINEMAELLAAKGYQGTFYLQQFLETETNLGDLQSPALLFDPQKLSSIIPIELRNF